MFMRSENLLLRPIWPEDAARVAALAIPADHALRGGAVLSSFLVLRPDLRDDPVIGAAGWTKDARGAVWLPRDRAFAREVHDSLDAMMARVEPAALVQMATAA